MRIRRMGLPLYSKYDGKGPLVVRDSASPLRRESLKIRQEMAAVMYSTAEVPTTQVDMNLTRNLRDWMSQ